MYGHNRSSPKVSGDQLGAFRAKVSGSIPKMVVGQSGEADGNMPIADIANAQADGGVAG